MSEKFDPLGEWEERYVQSERAFSGPPPKPPINLAERKQDSRLWTPADMVCTVGRELAQNNCYGGKRVVKAAVVLYCEGEDRQVAVVQSGCSMVELVGVLRMAEQAVHRATVE